MASRLTKPILSKLINGYIFVSKRRITDFTFVSDASYNFNDRIIGITGAYGGFGSTISSRIIKNGGSVVAVGRNKETLDKMQKTFGSQLIGFIVADISSEKGQNDIIDGLTSYKVDSLINNAGTFEETELISNEFNRNNYDKIMNTNLTAPLFITNGICKYWTTNNIKGTILNISSFASLSPLRGHLFYSISKSGLDILTSQIALELTSKNIRVNSINATVAKSAMGTGGKGFWNDDYRKKWFMDRVCIDRFVDVEEIGSIACYLLSKECPLIGQCIAVCGGMSNGATNINSQMILPNDYNKLKQENQENKEKIKKLVQKLTSK